MVKEYDNVASVINIQIRLTKSFAIATKCFFLVTSLCHNYFVIFIVWIVIRLKSYPVLWLYCGSNTSRVFTRYACHTIS